MVSWWPISKISGSICASALLPVKVGCALVPACAGRGGASLTVQHHRTSFKRGDEGRAIIVGVHFGGGDEQQIVEAGAGQQARDGHAGEHALLRQRFDDLGGGLCELHGELVEERLVQHLDARHGGERDRRASPHWRG